jgi:hypothetical protein
MSLEDVQMNLPVPPISSMQRLLVSHRHSRDRDENVIVSLNDAWLRTREELPAGCAAATWICTMPERSM